jgi:hypothetical protein
MGTSTSHGGPKDKKPLLPSWALPADNTNDNDIPPAGDNAGNTEPPGNGQETIEPQYTWQSAKRQMTNFASSGGGREGIVKAGGSYVSAKGGTRAASMGSVSGKSVAAKVGSFLGTISSHGIHDAIASLGFITAVGESAEIVFAKIANALSPAGATREEVAARKAVDDVLCLLYEKFIGDGEDISSLDRMTAVDISDSVEQCVSSYIYHRWLEELGFRIEKGSITENTAVELENQMKEYVKECVSLETDNIDIINFDWQSPQGQQIIDRVFNDAYSILEAGS